MRGPSRRRFRTFALCGGRRGSGVPRSRTCVRPYHCSGRRHSLAARGAPRRAGNSPGARHHARLALRTRWRVEPASHATRGRAGAKIRRAEKFMIQVTEETRSGWFVVGVRGRADAEAAAELEAALRAPAAKNPKVAA